MLSFEQQLESLAERMTQALKRTESLIHERASADISPSTLATLSEAIAFNLERAAWTLIEQAQAWVYELRLGLPRKETECLDLLQRHGWLELDVARRFKQLSEFRSLSSREAKKVDWTYLGQDLTAELALFREWADQIRHWKRPNS